MYYFVQYNLCVWLMIPTSNIIKIMKDQAMCEIGG